MCLVSPRVGQQFLFLDYSQEILYGTNPFLNQHQQLRSPPSNAKMPRRAGRFYVYYRCEDDESRARFVRGQGIVAKSQEPVPMNPKTRKDQARVVEPVLEHLDWRSRRPSPFISTSRSKKWVYKEARRRVEAGRTNVRVYRILIPHQYHDGQRRGRRNTTAFCKSVMAWLDLANEEIPWYANFAATDDEYLFLHCIPEEFIRELD